MLIGGLWHGANIRFILWGLMHGLGLIINKYWEKWAGKPLEISGIKRILSQIVTFHFVCLAWIIFRAQDMNTVTAMLSQIAGNFGFKQIISVIEGYSVLFGLILVGFVIHWLPWKIKENYRGWFITTPMMLKVIIFIAVILFLYQVKSAVIQPFIYFQF
jgi:hypothetical protein